MTGLDYLSSRGSSRCHVRVLVRPLDPVLRSRQHSKLEHEEYIRVQVGVRRNNRVMCPSSKVVGPEIEATCLDNTR